MNNNRLMIVDDSSTQRNNITRLSESLGFTVVGSADNATTAVEVYSMLSKVNNRPDIVTMDLTMPGLESIDLGKMNIAFADSELAQYRLTRSAYEDLEGGLKCILALKKIDPRTNILVISALSDKETGIRAMTLGARGILLKPFNIERLGDYLAKFANNPL